MAQQTAPHLESFDDIHKNVEKIKDWALANPVDDHIYKFPKPDTPYHTYPPSIQKLGSINACVAGSSALHCFASWLFPTKQQKWTPTDVDIFFLGHDEHPTRMLMGNVDIIQSTEKSVEELLMDFDLPVCRAAYNFSGDVFVSAQCLCALYTRRQNLPSCLQTKHDFMARMPPSLEYYNRRNSYLQYLNKEPPPCLDRRNEHLYNRFAERVKKYQDRGIGVNWIETDNVDQFITSMKKRYHYLGWKE